MHDESYITVTQGEMRTAILVWLRTFPASVWRDVDAQERLKKAKRLGGEVVDAQAILADHLAEKFATIGWEARYKAPKPLGSPPPWDAPRTIETDQGEAN